jgi:hypothetical protein
MLGLAYVPSEYEQRRQQLATMSYDEAKMLFDQLQQEWIQAEASRQSALQQNRKDLVRAANLDISKIKSIIGQVNIRLRALGQPQTIYRPDSRTCHPPGKPHYKCSGPPGSPGSAPSVATTVPATGKKIWCNSSTYAYRYCAPGEKPGPCTKSLPAVCKCCPPASGSTAPAHQPQQIVMTAAEAYAKCREKQERGMKIRCIPPPGMGPEPKPEVEFTPPDWLTSMFDTSAQDDELSALQAQIEAQEKMLLEEQQAWQREQAEWAMQQTQQDEIGFEQPTAMPMYAAPAATGPAYEPTPVAQLAPKPITPEEAETRPVAVTATAKKEEDKKKALLLAAIAGALILL